MVGSKLKQSLILSLLLKWIIQEGEHNPAIKIFLRAGFEEEYRTKEIIMLKKVLNSEAML